HFPEMALIDISDLDELAAQINEQTANDEEFLTKICPFGTKDFREFLGNETQSSYLICEQIAKQILPRILILQARLQKAKNEK
ncbi:2007_t:CDS:1, partial [Racocetra persica]